MVYGVDLSKHNASVPIEKLKQYGYEFAILRIGIRGYLYPSINKDPYFEDFFNRAKASGLGVGVYFFTQATNSYEAREEAEWVIKELAGRKLEYPVYIDQEWANDKHTGRADYNTVETNTIVCETFCTAIEEAGYYTGIYTSESWLAYRVISSRLTMFDKWIAKWGTAMPSTRYGMYGMWQHTNMLNIDGIRIDGDVAYYNYPKIMKDNGLNNYTDEGIVGGEKYNISIKNITNGDKVSIEAYCKNNSLNIEMNEITYYTLNIKNIPTKDKDNIEQICKDLYLQNVEIERG